MRLNKINLISNINSPYIREEVILSVNARLNEGFFSNLKSNIEQSPTFRALRGTVDTHEKRLGQAASLKQSQENMILKKFERGGRLTDISGSMSHIIPPAPSITAFGNKAKKYSFAMEKWKKNALDKFRSSAEYQKHHLRSADEMHDKAVRNFSIRATSGQPGAGIKSRLGTAIGAITRAAIFSNEPGSGGAGVAAGFAKDVGARLPVRPGLSQQSRQIGQAASSTKISTIS